MSPEIAGSASSEGTSAYADLGRDVQRLPAAHYRKFGDLTLTSLGVGTYLGEADDETDRAVASAVYEALLSGAVNVIDTAINYRSQKAERSVAKALARAIKEKRVDRDQVFVSTKNGYLAPDADADVPPRQWIQQELIGTKALDPADIVGGSHAMSVPFLRDQLARSLHNLNLETVDLLYLHNAPEAQLEEVGRPLFLERLEAAFRFYEEARKKGRIRSYGMATWDAFRVGRTEPGYLALEDVVKLATKVGGEDHGFRYIQFPFNLAMPEAAMLKNQPVGAQRITLFEAAHRLGVGTFSSVPLMQGRLAHWGATAPGLSGAQTALQFARSAPHHIAPLVGQKTPEHAKENLAVSESPPLDAAGFQRLLDA